MSKLFTFWVVVVFTIFNTTFALSANVSVKVTVTKTADLGMPEINEIVSKVNTTALSGAMQANYSLPDKQNLTVHMVFYHQKYIGALELKNENTLTTDQYVQEWKTTHNTGNHILFLFTWNESNNLYEHKKLDVSPAMETNHLFTEVMNFIRANLSGSAETVVEKGSRFLANAIRPVWDKDDVKKGEAEALVGEDRYKKYHFNFFNNQWAGSSLLTLEPIGSNTSGMIRINSFRYQTQTIFPSINIYIHSSSIAGTIEMTDETGVPYDYFTFENIQENIQMNIDELSLTMIDQIDYLGYYSETLSTAQWAWDINPYQLKSTNNLRTYQPTDNFSIKKIMAKGTIEEGQIKPPWIICYNATYCNLYASDLSRDILFKNFGLFSGNLTEATYAPWGPHDRASYLHDAMADSDKFFPLKNGEDIQGFVDAWKFTNAGYVVYLSAYNRRYYANPPGNIHPGHIVTCYPTRPNEIELRNWKDALIIQAGGSTNKTAIDNAWINPNFSNGEERGDRQKVHAHLYLGYILKTN